MATMTMTKRRSRTQTTPENNPRHPLAMPATVSIEMWERFSFYGMQAILAYYLYYATTDGGLGLERAQATTLLGAYGASVYLCTLAGGWIGDRLIGTERTLLTGCIALMVGHLSLSTLSGGAGTTFGLALIAIGSGFVKTAAITILGHAYPTDDPRRDAGFQLFYLGINIGAVLGPLLTGWLSTKYTFHTGFLAAAGLMGIGLITYLALRRRYLTALSPDTATALTAPTNPISFGRAAITISVVIAGIVGLGVLVRVGTIPLASLATILLVLTLSAAVVLYVSMFRSRQVTASERRQLLRYIPIFVASCTFWSILNQTYGVFAVYSDIRLDRTIGTFTIPAAWTQSLNPLYILALSVPIAWAWAKIGDRAPSAPVKMGCGVMLTGAGMLVLLPFTGGGESSTPFLALALCVLIVSLGELLVGPVGMSATTAHAPGTYRTRFSALYFLTMAIGTSTAGTLSGFYHPESGSAEFTYFVCCGLAAVIIGAGTTAMSARMK